MPPGKFIKMDFIPLSKPNIIAKDLKLVESVIRSGMLVQGKYVAELEKAFEQRNNSTYANALSNGTVTLHLALKILDIKQGDEVIVPAFSYVATANVVEHVGATPVFVDIDLSTYNIDVSKIENAITSKTKAIIPVHEFGLSCDIDAVVTIAKKYKLFVIEDAACALGASYNGQPVGTFGDLASFSFHPRKAITSGEGGMLLTSNLEYNRKIKLLRNHGAEITDGKMNFVDFGFNYRMTDFQAALVLSQFNRLHKSIAHKHKLSIHYSKKLNQKKLLLPYVPSYALHTWQTYHVIVSNEINRDMLIDNLKQYKIGTNYGAQCIPHVTAYQMKYKLDCKTLFPNAYTAYMQGLALPMYDLLNEQQVNYISKTINTLI